MICTQFWDFSWTLEISRSCPKHAPNINRTPRSYIANLSMYQILSQSDEWFIHFFVFYICRDNIVQFYFGGTDVYKYYCIDYLNVWWCW